MFDSSINKKKYLYIIKIIETINAGTCIFRSPLSNSFSEVEITSVDKINIEIKDFESTVRKITIPLTVTAKVKILRFSLNNSVPLFTNGIKIETDNGNKKSRKVLLRTNKKFDLSSMISKKLKHRYESSTK